MPKWRKEGIFIEPLFKMKCLGCRDPLAAFEERGYALQNFPVDENKSEGYNSYAMDRTYFCNLCGWRTVFGLALKKEHFEEVVKYEDERNRGNPSYMKKTDFF